MGSVERVSLCQRWPLWGLSLLVPVLKHDSFMCAATCSACSWTASCVRLPVQPAAGQPHVCGYLFGLQLDSLMCAATCSACSWTASCVRLPVRPAAGQPHVCSWTASCVRLPVRPAAGQPHVCGYLFGLQLDSFMCAATCSACNWTASCVQLDSLMCAAGQPHVCSWTASCVRPATCSACYLFGLQVSGWTPPPFLKKIPLDPSLFKFLDQIYPCVLM